MNQHTARISQPVVPRQWRLNIIALLVATSGLTTISSILFALVHFRRYGVGSTDAHLTLLAGLSLIYLASLLNRGKYTAWLLAITIYSFLVVRDGRHFFFDLPRDMHQALPIFINLVLPLTTLIALIINRKQFNVRSEVRNFATAAQRSLIILFVAFVYGIAGFSLLDQRDFHQEISLPLAAHYTVDQFGLTTEKQVNPYSKRAHIFVDSLAVISLGALFYAIGGLFSPTRFRLGHHQQDYDEFSELLKRHSTSSDDFFMLWPRDKSYFFNHQRTAAVAYKATHGVALIVGDPVAPKNQAAQLIVEFMGFCRINDWQPALIHSEAKNLELYKMLGFDAQKIGEEAIVDVKAFSANVANSKYFRHIRNKFEKLGYTCQVVDPPYDDAIISRLNDISKDWLKAPGRAERGFMLGYFTHEYIQQCQLIVATDSEGQIQAFVNRVPSPRADEANFDFLRHSGQSPGNINDFLMLNFIDSLHKDGVDRLNMGLSALSGIEEAKDSESRLLNSFLGFAYTNGNRFFSFQGLKRYKSKYEPEWESRYIIYRGGIRGFSKTLKALIRAMRL